MSLARLSSHRNKSYLEFIRTRPSTISQRADGAMVAHHVRCLGGGGMGLKPSDYFCLPLLAAEHFTLHNTGEKRYWDDFGVDPMKEILMNLLIYVASYGVRNVITDVTMITNIIEALEAGRQTSAKGAK